MRKLLVGTIVIGAVASMGACSKAPDETPIGSPGGATADRSIVADTATDSGAARAPGIDLTAAPGVAFAYRYAFRLPSDRIAAVQEAHAQLCEKLGVARCRITGMRYRLLGENNIEAMLAFRLDPALARQFGKDGIAAVTGAQGKLVDAEISGTDAGSAIKQLGVEHTRTENELQRIDRELARPGLKSAEREELQRQRTDAVQRAAANRDTNAQQQESLATTPMTFEYGSGAAVRGFDASAPFTSALDTAIGSATFTLAFLLGAVALLGPPGLVVLAGFLLWRRFGPRRAAPPS